MNEVDTDHGATIDAWRVRGYSRHDPVRFRFIEALARRTLTLRGAARRILDDRLAQLLTTYGEDVERTRVAKDATDATDTICAETDAAYAPMLPGSTGVSDRSALAELASHLASRATQRDGDSEGAIDRSMTHTLRYFRSTWSKLSADRRLSPFHATVPDNPGPLNSHHLVHQALKSMRDLSPGYLSHFMSHVDALLWLDDAESTGLGMTAAAGAAQRDGSPKKAVRGRPTENDAMPSHSRRSRGAL